MEVMFKKDMCAFREFRLIDKMANLYLNLISDVITLFSKTLQADHKHPWKL